MPRPTRQGGPEGRQTVAHGVSRGFEGQASDTSSPGGAAEGVPRRPPAIGAEILPPLPGLGMGQGADLPPRLAPWAIFCRRSAAFVDS